MMEPTKKRKGDDVQIAHSVMHYYFCRVHQTLSVTPAMEAGISDHVWSLEEIIKLIQ